MLRLHGLQHRPSADDHRASLEQVRRDDGQRQPQVLEAEAVDAVADHAAEGVVRRELEAVAEESEDVLRAVRKTSSSISRPVVPAAYDAA